MSRRYRPLGAFRLLLAVLVVLQHFQHLLAPDRRGFFAHAGLGAVAVAIFFVISGFVVAEANLLFYRNRPWAFMANRLVRVVPPYFAALAVSVAVHALLFEAGRLVLWDYTLLRPPLDPRLLGSALLGLVPGFRTALIAQDFEFIPFVWTLRMEMAFYLASCATLVAARRWRRAVPLALACAMVSSGLFLVQMRPGLLSTAPMFLLGTALCLAQERATRLRLAFAAMSALLAAAGFLSWQQHGTPQPAAQFALLGVLLAGFLCLCVAQPGGTLAAWDSRLGALSYPLYLNHYAVGLAAYNLTARRGPFVYVVSIAVSIGVAWLMARIADAPFRQFRNRVRGSTL